MSLNYIEIGRNIVTARKAAKMTQSQLASKTGSEQGFISRVENGTRSINLELLVSIANELETSVDALLGSNLQYANQEGASPIDKLFKNSSPKERAILTNLLILMAEALTGHLK